MLKRLILLVSLLAVPGAAAAADLPCPRQFVGNRAPLIVNPKLGQRATAICYRGYAVLFSGISRTPLWSAEHLTRARVAAAARVKRRNSFHADRRVPVRDRSELSDYARSGYDRGHMAPSGDMPTAASQAESFSLANMIPQVPASNRGLWEHIEEATRALAAADGMIYVVSGPIFAGANLKSLKGRVLVPTSIFKAIYDPRRGAAAYVVPNGPERRYEDISIATLQAMTGINVFPALPAAVRATAIKLPEPEQHHRAARYHSRQRRR